MNTRDALIDLRDVVKEHLLPICQKHGGDIDVAMALRIEIAFANVDEALATTERGPVCRLHGQEECWRCRTTDDLGVA